ncbi:DUF3298 domain-containing protein [Roseivirga sp. BDSF3-8]|uniref:DUF3298 and DUF4163 domain-containing protein n=1 Tax=Roseivirga sp. BDSF3-8 TaxID=3241598 RepID=UPI003532078E
MRKLTFMFIASIFLAAPGCGQEEKEGDVPPAEDRESATPMAHPPAYPLEYTMVTLDTTLGNCEDTETFPACTRISLSYPDSLQGSSDLLRDSIGNLVREYVYENDARAQFFKKYSPSLIDTLGEEYRNMTLSKWEVTNDLSVEYNTPELVTLKFNTYQFTGGAHGNGSVVFFNFDPASGQKYSIRDLLKDPADMDSLNAVAETIFRQRYELGNQSFKTAGYWFQDNEFSLNDNFTITGQGLNFLYNAYEITSYAEGTPELFLPWNAISGLVDENKVPVQISVNQ